MIALVASLALAGCFYIDPINQRPSLDINQEVVGPVFREQNVAFTAIVVDPDDHGVDLQWRAYLCTDATTSADCDADPAMSGIGGRFEFTVPRVRLDMTTAVQGMRIVLNGIDDHGATAKPADQLELAVLDRSPTLEELRDVSIYDEPGPTYVVGMPIELYAKYTDGDDGLDDLEVDWKVFAPAQVPIDLTDKPVPQPDTTKRQVGKILRPQITGQWIVEVTITDPVRNSVKKSVTLTVVDDRAPCISVASPAVPPMGSKLPVTEPTLFQVPIVSDDLDSYPREGLGEFGETKFIWSILVPGNSRQIISGATGSSTLFDPAVYAPGTEIELRVEIFDRKQTPISCADGSQTCGPATCIQRQTWRVEAR